MTKTIDISLGGVLFHLEEAAYYKLKKYLQAVRRSLPVDDDVDEVMNEIEARIAELLLQKQATNQQVINDKQIDEVIAVMGQPEDFEEEPIQGQFTATHHVKKALFRDMDRSMIAGVAAGLAHYIGLDITLMRLIFVVLFFVTHGSFFLIYLLLWIVMPKAKTAADKLRMTGEKANLDNIVDKVTSDEPGGQKVRFSETLENTGSDLAKIVVKIIGFVILLVTGILLIGLFISALTISPLSDFNMVINQHHWMEVLHVPLGLISLLMFILIGFPVALLFLLGFKLLFPNSNALNKNVLIIAGTIWLLSLVYTTVKASSVLSHTNERTRIITLATQWQSQKDTLILKSFKNSISKSNFIAGNDIRYRFKASHDGRIHLKVVKTAEGITKNEAYHNAEEINFKINVDSIYNTINFAEMFQYPVKKLVSDHYVKVEVSIPENMVVQMDDNIASFSKTDDCDNPLLLKNEEGVLKCLEMLPDGDRQEHLEINSDGVHIKIGENGVHISANDSTKEAAEIKIDENGVQIKAVDHNKKTDITIDENGVKVKKNH